MTIKDMHYAVEFGLNKIDSNKYASLEVPQKDWLLNEAESVFIKTIAMPRYKSPVAFEKNQRTIDDIRNIVTNQDEWQDVDIIDDGYVYTLPDGYMFHISSDSRIKKGSCEKQVRNWIIQHDDMHRLDGFSSSSFEWEEVNIRFFDKGIRIFTDGTFTVEGIKLNYIRKPKYMHNAEDFLDGSYEGPNGISLQGSENCELAEHTHQDIVDIAVLLATNYLQIPEYPFKKDKLALTDARILVN